MKRNLTVSVVIPTFNRARLVSQAIESVLRQSFTDYEVIVVDDGSSDCTRRVLEPLVEAARIRYVFQENRGESAARNHGIRLARGEYIAFLDSDDLLLPQTLEKQAACLESSPEIGLVHGGYSKFDDKGRDLGYRDTSRFSGWVYPRILLEWSVLMAVPTVMVRRCVMAEVGGFDETMAQAADLDLWRRIARRYRFQALPQMLARVRQHEGNISGDRTLAANGYEVYLKKAFEEDARLSATFGRRAAARMYASVCNMLLAQCEHEQRDLVRRYCMRSIMQWPLQFRALVGLVGSSANLELTRWLVAKWRRYRYPPYKE